MDLRRSNGHGERGGMVWRVAAWACAGGALLAPLLIGAPWSLSDYVFLGVLLGGAGLAVELAVRASRDLAYRAGAAVAAVAAGLLALVNGAVGVLGSEDNPANLVFFGVIAVAVAGSLLAGFRAAGMARAMLATAAVQVLVGAAALGAGVGLPGYDGLYEVVLGTSLFSALWLVSAGLFRRSAAVTRAA